MEFARPSLGMDGDPVHAAWNGTGGTGAPHAYDSDVLFDDYMGPAQPHDPPTTASVEIENKGGNLSGPNGDVVNGGGDGDCAEVFLRWSYRYPVQITETQSKTVKGEAAGSGGSDTTTTTKTTIRWEWGFKESCVAEVCPC